MNDLARYHVQQTIRLSFSRVFSVILYKTVVNWQGPFEIYLTDETKKKLFELYFKQAKKKNQSEFTNQVGIIIVK